MVRQPLHRLKADALAVASRGGVVDLAGVAASADLAALVGLEAWVLTAPVLRAMSSPSRSLATTS
jgi:hypothetical protein